MPKLIKALSSMVLVGTLFFPSIKESKAQGIDDTPVFTLIKENKVKIPYREEDVTNYTEQYVWFCNTLINADEAIGFTIMGLQLNTYDAVNNYISNGGFLVPAEFTYVCSNTPNKLISNRNIPIITKLYHLEKSYAEKSLNTKLKYKELEGREAIIGLINLFLEYSY